ncbi:MAG TPA: N-acetylmuramic acid 6-phosphate etherase [Pseudogracilibacillus sp.]|nr:N-acetylmuramic acid 6-phosphate etherase [Pseudogracilibacillus sp.]
MNNLSTLITETRNKKSMNIDNMSTNDIIHTINNEDMVVAKKVQEVLPSVEATVDITYNALKQGGRLFYVGAGTSGRIGVLDAVECPPTFSTSSDMVQAVIAGGGGAFQKAAEGAEDNPGLGEEDLKERHLSKLDVVIGIAASGRTPYVLGALQYAQELGAKTISLTSNEHSEISKYADVKIEVVTGPEVLTGSTRMKAATAHKMILNMITTASMIKVGKVYENLMVDLKVSNNKLKERAKGILSTITEMPYEKSEAVLESTGYKVKPAIVMIKAETTYKNAVKSLSEAGGLVRQAIKIAREMN